MSDSDNTFIASDLTTIKGHHGQRFIIEFREILTDDRYLGKVLSQPEIRHTKTNQIHEVVFQKGIVNAENKKLASTRLKNKLDQSLNNLKKGKDSDPDAMQAYLIFNSFEKRWRHSICKCHR